MPRTRSMLRGYNISILFEDQGWRAWVRPRLPDVPIYRRHSFIVRGVSQDQALAEVKRWIDHFIST
jgi:hypothetical protein